MAGKQWWEDELDSDGTPEPQEKATLGVTAPAPLPKVKAESLTTANFMSHVLPGQGVYTLFTTGDKTNYWFDSLDDMIAKIEELSERPDCYYGAACFKERGTDKAGRTQANVARLKCFKLDLDAGEKKLKTQGPDKVYQDQAQALQALKAFTETTGLKPTFIVSSGEGLHVYYVLSEEVTPEQWRPVAKQLQEFGKSHGLKIDSSVTADHSRVLRPIGTMHPNGKRVEVLEHNNKSYTLAEFASIVGHVAADVGSTALPHSGGAFSADDLDINADIEPQYDDTPADFELIRDERDGCEAVRWAADPANQPHVEEPYWRGLLGIVKFCTGAEELAHEVSRHHPKYDRRETQRKLESWNTGPTTCDYFAGFNPDACGRCKHRQGGAA